MDLYIELLKVPTCDLSKSIKENSENESEKARQKVQNAWNRQINRCVCHDVTPHLNSRLPSEHIYDVFELNEEVTQFAMKACDKLDLSVRGYQKMIRVARTIADFDEEDRLDINHIAQALQFRRK
jgi:magnesium chelatase family protein